MKCKQLCPGFESESPCPFPAMVSIALRALSLSLSLSIYIYIYIYIYCHPRTDCFIVLQLYYNKWAKHVGRLKMGSKPTQLYVRISILPISQRMRVYVCMYVCMYALCPWSVDSLHLRPALFYVHHFVPLVCKKVFSIMSKSLFLFSNEIHLVISLWFLQVNNNYRNWRWDYFNYAICNY